MDAGLFPRVRIDLKRVEGSSSAGLNIEPELTLRHRQTAVTQQLMCRIVLCPVPQNISIEVVYFADGGNGVM